MSFSDEDEVYNVGELCAECMSRLWLYVFDLVFYKWHGFSMFL